MTRRVLPWAFAALGVALLVTGVAVFATTDTLRPVDFGWFAYTPLQPEPDVAYSSTLDIAFDGGAVVWTGGRVLGAGLAVAGLLVLAVLAGWAVGRRTGRATRAG